MNERYNVAQTNLTMKRSRFIERVPVYQHAFHGDLCIDLVLEMLPGDNIKVKLHDYTRMSVPIAPLMGNIRKHFASFMVPKRILWNNTKLFYGEAETFGIAETCREPIFSVSKFYNYKDAVDNNSSPYMFDYDFTISAGDTLSYFELDTGINPLRTFSSFMGLIAFNGLGYDEYDIDGDKATPVNALPLWAVLKCYNEHFRDQNFCEPYTWDMGIEGLNDDDALAYLGEKAVSYRSPLPKVRKDNDMFVSFLPWAQKGDPVILPLGERAFVYSETNDPENEPFEKNKTYSVSSLVGPANLSKVYNYEFAESGDPSLNSFTGHLVADLTNATAATISQLLYAFAYQDFLQRLCKFGSRYGDYIKAIFGVETDDATQDIPEFVGYRSMLLNIDTVVQTTDHDASESTKLGDLGGYSATRFDDSGDSYYINYGCKEPGYLCMFSYYKHERVYASGIDDIYLKSELLDYYQTPFANISDTPYPKALIRFTGDNAEDTKSFGFNEPFLGYRNHRPVAKGLMNPNIPGSLDYWVLADKYEDTPVLGQSFVEEDRNAIARALSTGEAGPDYISNTDYELDWVRVMPLYSSGRIGNF